MKPEEYWKNFNLGTELDIAGRFLYNGLQIFHQMETFSREEDAFEFLYAVCVGIERLIKIALILTEHDKRDDQEEFEKELITHSHQDLLARLKRHHALALGPAHNEFVSILSRFYKSHRYGRYSLASVYSPAQERDDLNSFFEKYLDIKIDIESMFSRTRNERRHKRFIGKVLSKIVVPIFEIIRGEAHRLNLYTYEIEYESKASKIFQFQSFDFENEDILQTEILAYFISVKASGANARFLREQIKALSFDSALEADYISALRSDRKKLTVMDEFEALYKDDVSDFATRREMLNVAISEYLNYEPEEGDEDKEDLLDDTGSSCDSGEEE
ncbi:hypothetical protein [Methylocapsa palsarum]|uniref:Uncharacterized protein n=1 Tax=Methylocapsa palsarum TaxID=1612308 RepID=A0A1I3W4R7_9HYPH|nr:hypothetical protein [Methylocapsa palsarum]SFK01421.1 hypothetical protein SAMN05444581_101287 [Methylocapsa palsarum]